MSVLMVVATTADHGSCGDLPTPSTSGKFRSLEVGSWKLGLREQERTTEKPSRLCLRPQLTRRNIRSHHRLRSPVLKLQLEASIT